jgi:hypothetical protein
MYNPNAKRRRIKPYARPTSFDYNVRYDIRQYQDVKYNRVKTAYFQTATNDEVFRVMEGELLVKSTLANSRYNDKELHVFSFANGLQAPNTAAIGGANRDFLETTSNSDIDQRAVRRYILGTVQYMGVAVTEFSPARDVYEQGFVATIAGLNTLYNNGTDTIYPGQTVCCDLPRLRQSNHGGTHYKRALQQGLPRDKLQFIIRPHDEMLKDYGDIGLVNRFIVGTAISYSRPGDTVDVILHRMNYTTVHEARSSTMSKSGAPGETDLSTGLLGQFFSNLIDPSLANKASEGVKDILNTVRATLPASIIGAVNEARGPVALASLTALGPDGALQDTTVADVVLRLSAEAVSENIPGNSPEGQIGATAVGDSGAVKTLVDKAKAGREKLVNLNGGSGPILRQSTPTSAGDGELLLVKVPEALGDEIKRVGGINNLNTDTQKKLANAINVMEALKNLAEVAATIQDELMNAGNPGKSLLGTHPLSMYLDKAPANVGLTWGQNRAVGGTAPSYLSLTSGPTAVATNITDAVGDKAKAKKKKR